jgi:putative transposase
MIGALKEHEADAKAADLTRKHGVLQLEGQVRRHDVSEAKRLKTLEDENAKLKKQLAEPMLDASALRELL